jgi:DNA processing protein
MALIYWLLLLRAPQLGVRTFYKALKVFESPEQVLRVSCIERKQANLFKPITLDYLNQIDESLVLADIEWQAQPDCHILTLIDEHYPVQLKTIVDPPPILYVRGDVLCLSKPQLAIVGSRNPTEGGKNNTYSFAKSLSENGLIITSGMAVGVDSQAHIGALEAGGKTIAVCGTGLDRIYPARHKNLAYQIANQGALVSEFAIGTKPLAQNFPRRNRIISGLSLGALIMEASLKSGTMITAKLSLDQGREVFAVPSSIHNPLSAGCHSLIQQGAALVCSPEDVLNELGWEFKNFVEDNFCEKKANTKFTVLLKYLSYDALSIDEMVEKTQLSVQVVTQLLLEMELEGRVERIANSGYILIK